MEQCPGQRVEPVGACPSSNSLRNAQPVLNVLRYPIGWVNKLRWRFRLDSEVTELCVRFLLRTPCLSDQVKMKETSVKR